MGIFSLFSFKNIFYSFAKKSKVLQHTEFSKIYPFLIFIEPKS